MDGNGSTSRVLNQLASTRAELNPLLPSMAEALAVMAGSVLVTSVENAPFVPYFVSSAFDLCQKITQLMYVELYCA